MLNKSFIQKIGRIIPIAVVGAAVAYFISGALGAGAGLQKGLVGVILVAMVYAILRAVPAGELKEKSFFQNIKFSCTLRSRIRL